MNHKQNVNWNPNFTFPLAFKTIPVCLTVIIILCLGEPDIIDGIVEVLKALAEYLRQPK